MGVVIVRSAYKRGLTFETSELLDIIGGKCFH